jgi:hypothetical protein
VVSVVSFVGLDGTRARKTLADPSAVRTNDVSSSIWLSDESAWKPRPSERCELVALWRMLEMTEMSKTGLLGRAKRAV